MLNIHYKNIKSVWRIINFKWKYRTIIANEEIYNYLHNRFAFTGFYMPASILAEWKLCFQRHFIKDWFWKYKGLPEFNLVCSKTINDH